MSSSGAPNLNFAAVSPGAASKAAGTSASSPETTGDPRTPSIAQLGSPNRQTARKLDYPREGEDQAHWEGSNSPAIGEVRLTARKPSFHEYDGFTDGDSAFSVTGADIRRWNNTNSQPATMYYNTVDFGFAPAKGFPATAFSPGTTTTTTTNATSIPVTTTTTSATVTTTTTSTGTAPARMENGMPGASGPTRGSPRWTHAEEKNLAGMVTTGVTAVHAQPGVRVLSSMGEQGLSHHVLNHWDSGAIGGSAESGTAALPERHMEVEYPSAEVLLDEIWRRDSRVVTEVESYVLWAAACQKDRVALDVLQYHDIAYHPKDKSQKGRGWHPEHCPLSAAITLNRQENLQILLARGAQADDRLLDQVRSNQHPAWVKALFVQHGRI